MPRKPAVDPLLGALIAKLPKGGEWAASARKDWLRMMEMAFDVVYGGSGQAMIEAAPQVVRNIAPVPVKTEHVGYDYYIDAQGFARCDIVKGDDGLPRSTPGRRVLPDEIDADESVYDYRRGEARNRETITWADDSVGAVPGMSFCGPG